MSVEFKVERIKDEDTNTECDALIKYTTPEGQPSTAMNAVDVPAPGVEREIWTTIPDLDRLFDACSKRWDQYGWDLDKLIKAVEECEFD
jgi:hypothetical protein